MKKASKLLALSLALAMAVSMAGCTSGGTSATPTPTAQAASYSIGVIQYVEHAALDAAREGFIAALADNGFVEGQNITFDIQNAQADQSNLKTISQRFVNNKVNLILAIATPAAQSIASETTEIPILATAVTDFTSAKLVDSDEKPGGNVTGTNDMNPIKEQIDLIVKLVPDIQTIGLLYTSSEDNSILQAGIVKDACEVLGLTVVEATVTSTNDVQQAAQSLSGKVDAIYIPTDNVLASAMPIIAAVATEAKIPTVCGESNMVINGGFATLGINYYNLGYQTGEMAVKVLNGEAEPATMPVESLTHFEFTINGEVAEALGITIPADLTDSVIYPSAE